VERIAKAGLKISPGKCQLFQRRVEFLEHIVSADGISTAPNKTESVEQWPSPKSMKVLRSYKDVCSYYRRFMRGFADIAKLLHKLTDLDAPF